MISRTRVTFILNGKSGSCDPTIVSETATRAAVDDGAIASIKVIEVGSDVEDLVRCALKSGAQIVVAGGGDGTLNAVAAALVGSQVPLGVLPLGTLNHFAKDLDIPLELEDALSTVSNGVARHVDVGEVNGRIFVNNSGIGLYPRIVEHREAIRRRGYPKWLALIRAALWKLRRYSLVRVSLKTRDGRALHRTTPFLFVGNNTFEISGLRTGTRERVDRGHLWVCLVPEGGRMKLAALAIRALFGRLRKRDIVAFEAVGVDVETRRKHQHVSCDGEISLLRTPLQYRVRPGALRVITPRSSSSPTAPA